MIPWITALIQSIIEHQVNRRFIFTCSFIALLVFYLLVRKFVS
uniref:Inner membrane protein n=1 Tax=Ascaris lumbricoides TaxID=6252 RepID=A0A0M3HL55_ASCLU